MELAALLLRSWGEGSSSENSASSWLEQVHLRKWVVLIPSEPWSSTRGDFARSREQLATPDTFYCHDMGMGGLLLLAARGWRPRVLLDIL